MKKFTLFLSALLISAMSFAADITITSAETVTQDGVTIVFDKASGSNAPAWYAAGLRLYAKNTVTISAETEITNITFNWEKQGSKQFAGLTANVGTYTHPESAGEAVWTGSAKEVVFTVGDKGQLQLNTLSVTVGAGQDDGNDPEPEEPETPTDPEEPETPTLPEGVITCVEAVAICQETGETATSENYTIRGYVTEIKTAYSSQYGNISFWMADTKDGGKVLQTYRVKPTKAGEENVKVGDFVEVVGKLVNFYGNTPEVAQGGTYTILEAAEGGTTPEEPETPDVETVGNGTEENPFTVEDVIALNNTLSGKHYVKAYIVGQATGASFVDGLDLEAPFEGATNSDGSVATQGTNLAIASTLTPDTANIIPVQLPKNNLRNDFNLVEHPEMLGKQVLICGELVKYFSLTGIKNPTSIVLVNTTETAVDNVTVNQNITKFFENGQLIIIKDGVKFNAQGQVVK